MSWLRVAPVVLTFLAACTPGASGLDAGLDASPLPDEGMDIGGDDLGPPDLGPPDLGPPDLGPPDLGLPCIGPPGLYADTTCTTLAAGVRAFAPRYVLWSDAAAKERFIYLPPGTQIDTSDPDHWIFPVGTSIWKTFSLGGRRLETRLLSKSAAGTTPAAWSMRAYLWDATGTSVHELVGGMDNVLGTMHDVPAEALCVRCHAGNLSDAPLGFGAIQLNHSMTPTTLDDLQTEGWLTTPISVTAAVVPGTGVTRDALGYLQANCAPCHSGATPSGGMNLQVTVGLATPEDSNAYHTAVNMMSGWSAPGATLRVSGGMPDASTMIRRMEMRGTGTAQMPPLATELVDDTGVTTIRDWITIVPP